ncbi:CHAP domain-containing protein [Nocardia flavorosea]|uniref:CHAP domain-containing protein n=1 Tax=Nocardia flavorosea TaxID=53429 RepID=A0A846YCU1_9NOCA|nr:CHAP domain-containing protein [Nocardia flavorosea]NKY56425.1 CHAP domain-containing protein [Nocardia flavorosea]
MTDKDHGKLNIELTPPEGIREGARAVIEGVEENIQSQVLLLASNDTTYDPDMVSWLENRGMLGPKGLDAPEGESVMIEDYGGRRGEIENQTADMQAKNDSVDAETYAAFSTTNQSFQDISSKVRALQEVFDGLPGRVDSDLDGDIDGNDYMPIVAECAAVGRALNTLAEVIDIVDGAQAEYNAGAERIERLTPGNSGDPNVIWGDRSPTSNMTFTVTGDATRDSILGIARDELGRGVAERGGSSNTAYYTDTGKNTPYNIGDAWCASFTSYVWEKAGYEVDWTNKNYVPAIWNDAKANLETATANQAEPGDLIIFDWQGDGTPDHIGIVESVNGSTITTIEGNSSNQLRSNSYQMGNADLVGVVKPPASKSGAVV